ncbi:hypothetical protein BGZ60DRAFT_432708 [Tricladium varicosporioides]|nr:hypothetical protein BGZ60DRAFT_432708 [Hymenoscyphus varicosporioides]
MAEQSNTRCATEQSDETTVVDCYDSKTVTVLNSRPISSRGDCLPELYSSSLGLNQGMNSFQADNDSDIDSNDSYYSEYDVRYEDNYEDSYSSMSPSTRYSPTDTPVYRSQDFSTTIVELVRNHFTRPPLPATNEAFRDAIYGFQRTATENPSFPYAIPTEPELCSYVLDQCYAYPELSNLALQHLAGIASSAQILSHGTTETRYIVVPAFGIPEWEICAPHSAFLALYDALEQEISSRSDCVLPEFPQPKIGESVLRLVSRKELFLQQVLALPVDVLRRVPRVGQFFAPIMPDD